MATYKVGSSGDGVRELQELLNANGANLTVDGVYGNNTANAVRQYQQSKGLSVDGIAGEQTFNSLRSAGSTASGETVAKTPQTSAEWLKYYESNKPADYNSTYQGQIDDLLAQITGRKPFQYDYASDPLYQQYAQNYQRMGKLAMQDTMGQAAALTGGYGNTYATTAGQQMYNQYMQELNGIIPELQQNAYGMYADEGDRMAQMLAIYQAADDAAYKRYMDQYGMWQDERDYWHDRYMDEQALAAASRGGGGGGGGSSRSSSAKTWSDSEWRSSFNNLKASLSSGGYSHDAIRSKFQTWYNNNASKMTESQRNAVMQQYTDTNQGYSWYLSGKKGSTGTYKTIK